MSILILVFCLIAVTPLLSASVHDGLPLFRTRARPVLVGNQPADKNGSSALPANRVQYYGKAPYSTAGRLYFRADVRDRKHPARR
jgi:hypothetical protein